MCPHNKSITVCPCPKDCPRHGHCCACVAHHKQMGTKLPTCLHGIDWEKQNTSAFSQIQHRIVAQVETLFAAIDKLK